MLFLTLTGEVAGYLCSRLCKVFEGDDGRWKAATILAAFPYLGFFFAVFAALDLQGSVERLRTTLETKKRESPSRSSVPHGPLSRTLGIGSMASGAV